MSFVPSSIGLYTIMASFPSNDRYAASSASTSVNMGYDYATLITTLATIIGMIVVVSALYLLRKKGMKIRSIILALVYLRDVALIVALCSFLIF